MSSFVTFIQRKVEYVQLMSECGSPRGTPKFDKLCHDLVTAVLQQLAAKKDKLQTDEAKDVKDTISKVLGADQTNVVMQAFDTKAELHGAGCSDVVKQHCVHLDGFLEVTLWDFLQDPNHDIPFKTDEGC